MPDFVKLVNKGQQPFDFHQNNAKRVIEPGGDVIVPWNIAATLFGDPNIPDIPPVNERTRMYGKIRARHNFSNGLMTESDWEDLKPDIGVYDIENNGEIIMLIDDPEGNHMGGFTPSPAPSKQNDVEALQRQIAALTAQVERVVGQQNAAPTPPAESGTSTSPTATADGPGVRGSTPDTPADNTPADNTPADIDPVFDIATEDTAQATPVGEIEHATEDTPKPAKKVAAKKVASKK